VTVTTPFDDRPGLRRLVVTGHPNHELAILGFAQRFRPRFLFLTDGGAEARMNESREALASLGLLDQARFLAWPEERLYRALLDGDLPFFREVVAQVRSEIDTVSPAEVLCERIEYYNPLHDVTLPIVRAALRGRPARIVEFPLIAQEPGEPERYRVNRLAPGDPAEVLELRLTPDELATKLEAGERRYPSLRRQMGAVLDGLPPERSAVEHFVSAAAGLPAPGPEDVLRYEWRGRRLKDGGQVDRVITWTDHFLPFAKALEAAPG